MPTTTTWHGFKSKVYHDNTLCTTGNNIEHRNTQPGKGKRRRCKQCGRLSIKGKGIHSVKYLKG